MATQPVHAALAHLAEACRDLALRPSRDFPGLALQSETDELWRLLEQEDGTRAGVEAFLVRVEGRIAVLGAYLDAVRSAVRALPRAQARPLPLAGAGASRLGWLPSPSPPQSPSRSPSPLQQNGDPDMDLDFYNWSQTQRQPAGSQPPKRERSPPPATQSQSQSQTQTAESQLFRANIPALEGSVPHWEPYATAAARRVPQVAESDLLRAGHFFATAPAQPTAPAPTQPVATTAPAPEPEPPRRGTIQTVKLPAGPGAAGRGGWSDWLAANPPSFDSSSDETVDVPETPPRKKRAAQATTPVLSLTSTQPDASASPHTSPLGVGGADADVPDTQPQRATRPRKQQEAPGPSHSFTDED